MEEMMIILALVFLNDFTVVLYPKDALPDLITNWRRELMDSTVFFDFLAAAAGAMGLREGRRGGTLEAL